MSSIFSSFYAGKLYLYYCDVIMIIYVITEGHITNEHHSIKDTRELLILLRIYYTGKQ